MSYFDIYKKKLKNRGGTSGNSFKESGLEFIKRNFSDDPSYREATIISKENYEESDIDIRIENIDASANEIKLVANDMELGIETRVEGNIVERRILWCLF